MFTSGLAFGNPSLLRIAWYGDSLDGSALCATLTGGVNLARASDVSRGLDGYDIAVFRV
jgi:hypothetical protein